MTRLIMGACSSYIPLYFSDFFIYYYDKVGYVLFHFCWFVCLFVRLFGELLREWKEAATLSYYLPRQHDEY